MIIHLKLGKMVKYPKSEMLPNGRKSLMTVIEGLTNNRVEATEYKSPNWKFSVEQVTLDRDLESILSKQRLPFNIGDSKVYSIDLKRQRPDEGFFRIPVGFSIPVGSLFVGDNWALFGEAQYGVGRTENCHFSYRQGETLTLQYLNESCVINEDRTVTVERKEDSLRINLSDEPYEVDELSSLKISYGSHHYFGAVLLSGRLNTPYLIWNLTINTPHD